jgi:iduronate 2-sulfatase
MKQVLNAVCRFSLLILIMGFLSCGGGNNQNQEKTIAPGKPNVLFIAVDDLNDWIGVMNGHPNAKTPNLDRLASKGVLFTNAHCQAPLCGPSRASLMTGLRPSTSGIYGMIDDDLIRNDNEVTKEIVYLPEYFRNNGYHTMGIGKLFHTHAPEGAFDESGGREKGFGPLPEERFVWDGYGSGDENYGRTNTDWGAFPANDSLMPDYRSSQWAIERLGRVYDQPFFLAVGYLRPHVPLYAPQKWFDLHQVEDLTMPPYKADDLTDIPEIGLMLNDLPMMPSTEWAIKNNEWANIVQAYLACVSFVDNQVGEVLKALENSKYADNTIVVMWSDHGYRLGEKGTFAKHCLWEEATNAPLMFAGPGISEGEIIDQPVEMLSIYPTLLELCGLPDYDRNEGRSLANLMKGSSEDADAVAITTFGMNNHSVRSGQYRYIQYEDGSEELYDRKVDPNEWENLASHENYTELKNVLKPRLPSKNVKWTKNSEYKFQPYFGEQKERTGKTEE